MLEYKSTMFCVSLHIQSIIILCFTSHLMPCRSDEKEVNPKFSVQFETPPRKTRNGRAGPAGPANSEREVTDAELEGCLALPTDKSPRARKWNSTGDYTKIKS
jgi:hypothetical protein